MTVGKKERLLVVKRMRHPDTKRVFEPGASIELDPEQQAAARKRYGDCLRDPRQQKPAPAPSGVGELQVAELRGELAVAQEAMARQAAAIASLSSDLDQARSAPTGPSEEQLRLEEENALLRSRLDELSKAKK